MARTPTIPADDYARIIAYLAAQRYDITKLQKIPHSLPDKCD